MNTLARVVPDNRYGSVVETVDLESLEVRGARPFGPAGRGPLPFAVSIIIRARNEAALLPTTLQAIAGQVGGSADGGAVQVIVVDDHSTDATPAIARQYGAELVALGEDSFSYGGALNVGVRHARGEVLVLLSAHAVPAHALWLANLVVPFAHDSSLAGTFGSDWNWPDATLADRLAAELRVTHTAIPRLIAPPAVTFSNANGAVRADLARALPFCESIPSSEDAVWAGSAIAHGYRILYTPWAPVWHSHYNRFGDLVYIVGRALAARAQVVSGACPVGA